MYIERQEEIKWLFLPFLHFHFKTKKHEHWNSLVVSNQELVCQEFEEELKGEDDCRDKKTNKQKEQKKQKTVD